MKTFTINGTEYKAKPFDFEMVCDLEDMGVSLEKAQGMPMSLIRAYFALCAGKDRKTAAKEIERHFINGGDFNELSEIINEEVDKSDFFRAMQERAAENTTEDKEETAEGKKTGKK